MLSKIAVLTLVIPLISALTLNVPSKTCTSGGQCTITWTADPTDPSSFTLELFNTAFHDSFAIGNNLVPSAGSATIELPIIPAGGGYTLEAVAIGNIGDVLSTTGSFSIGAEVSTTSTTSTSTTSSTSSTSSGLSSGAKSSSTSISIATPATASSFGVTTTAPASSITPAGTGTSTGTPAGAAATTSSSSFNAASSLNFGVNAGTMMVLLLSAVAGVAVVAL